MTVAEVDAVWAAKRNAGYKPNLPLVAGESWSDEL